MMVSDDRRDLLRQLLFRNEGFLRRPVFRSTNGAQGRWRRLTVGGVRRLCRLGPPDRTFGLGCFRHVKILGIEVCYAGATPLASESVSPSNIKEFSEKTISRRSRWPVVMACPVATRFE